MALAASGLEPAVRPALELVEETGGRAEASVLGAGDRVPAMMAAFANGALAHGLDYDDQTPWGQHSSSSVVLRALAVAERRGGVPGADLIAAVAVGQDIFARLRCHVGWRKDWNLSSVLGVFAGAAAAGAGARLTSEQMQHALGIASQQSCGVMEVVAGTGSDLRGMYAGFSAKGAVLAAVLAERGVTGVDGDVRRPIRVLQHLLRRRVRPRPRSSPTWARTTAAARRCTSRGRRSARRTATSTPRSSIVTENDLDPDDIDEIRVHVGDYHDLMCTPLEVRRNPTTLVDAKFSLPFLVAIAAARRGMRLVDFTETGLRDPVVRRLAERVVPVPDGRLDWKLELPPGVVEIVTRDGRSFEREGNDPPGGTGSPLSWDQLADKFTECVSLARRPLGAEQARAAVAMARDLEGMADATELPEGADVTAPTGQRLWPVADGVSDTK